MNGRAVYFDQAATSWPKPPAVIQAVNQALIQFGGNPGHGGHRMAMRAAQQVFRTREEAAHFFGAEPENVIFTASCTHALNMALKGIMEVRGGHLLASMYDHNASLRPAAALALKGVCTVGFFPVYEGEPQRTLSAFKEMLRPDTRCVVCTHASNVTGAVLPVREIYEICRKEGIVFILDAAQTAGVLPVSLRDADIICTAGHKSLLGIQGSGMMILRPGLSLSTLMEGGTGIRSLERDMPEDSPERFEAGTLGLPGIMALGAGMREVRRVGLQRIYRNEMAIADRFYRGLQHIPGVRVVNRGFKMGEYVPVVSFCIGDRDGGTVSEQLSAQGFMLRGGYHCAGMIHDLLGTRDTGTVRFACGRGAAPEQVDALLKVVKKISAGG